MQLFKSNYFVIVRKRRMSLQLTYHAMWRWRLMLCLLIINFLYLSRVPHLKILKNRWPMPQWFTKSVSRWQAGMYGVWKRCALSWFRALKWRSSVWRDLFVCPPRCVLWNFKCRQVELWPSWVYFFYRTKLTPLDSTLNLIAGRYHYVRPRSNLEEAIDTI